MSWPRLSHRGPTTHEITQGRWPCGESALKGWSAKDSAELMSVDLEVQTKILTSNLPLSYRGYLQASGPEQPVLIDSLKASVAAVAPIPGVTDRVALVLVTLVSRLDGLQSERPADPGTNAFASMV